MVNIAGGFAASTLGISDQQFRRHKSNVGTITIGRGGYAALIGGEIKNSGLISVPMGKVGIGSGEAATLDVSGRATGSCRLAFRSHTAASAR